MNITLVKVSEVLARIFLVFWFSICVVDGWGYLFFDVYLTGEPTTLFLSSLMQVMWFWWTLKIVQTLGLLSLLFNYKPALGLALLTPTSIFICLFYFFQLSSFIPFGVLIILSTLILGRKYAQNYLPLLRS